MTRKPQILRPILFATALSSLIAFGALALPATGYVGDLGGLVSISQSGFDLAFAKSGALPKGYSAVYVAPVGIIEGQDKRLGELSASDRQDMQDYLYKQLNKSLGKKFSLATAPAAGVLIVDAKFTALTPNKPTMSDLSRQPGIDYARSFGIGKAGIQIELRDGASGELLAAFADQDEGDSLDSNTNAVIQWGDAEEFSRDWAGALADMLSG